MPGLPVKASGAFTRPADTTAYAAGDLVANSTTAGSVVPITLDFQQGGATGNIWLRTITLKKSNTGTTNATFRLWFFDVIPTMTNGDNGAFAGPSFSNVLMSPQTINASVALTGAGAIGVLTVGSTLYQFRPVTYALLEATAAYTPASAEVFTLDVTGEM